MSTNSFRRSAEVSSGGGHIAGKGTSTMHCFPHFVKIVMLNHFVWNVLSVHILGYSLNFRWI